MPDFFPLERLIYRMVIHSTLWDPKRQKPKDVKKISEKEVTFIRFDGKYALCKVRTPVGVEERKLDPRHLRKMNDEDYKKRRIENGSQMP